MKEGLLNFFNPTGLDHTAIWSVNMCYSSIKGKNHPPSDSEMIMTTSAALATAQSLGYGTAQSLENLLLSGKSVRAGLPTWRVCRWDRHLCGSRRWDRHPVYLEDRALNYRSLRICLARFFTFLGRCHPILLSYFSLLEWDAYPMPVPPSYFGST